MSTRNARSIHQYRNRPASAISKSLTDPCLSAAPLSQDLPARSFFLSTYLYFQLRATYMMTYEYRHIHKGYRGSCANQTTRRTLRKKKNAPKSLDPSRSTRSVCLWWATCVLHVCPATILAMHFFFRPCLVRKKL